MPPRLNICPRCIHNLQKAPSKNLTRGLATAITPASSPIDTYNQAHPVVLYPETQPPSFKTPAHRHSQLIRLYASLLRSTPLMIFFQHNNLKRNEWIFVRRELVAALRKTDTQLGTDLASDVKISVINNRMFEQALATVEFYNPYYPDPPPPPRSNSEPWAPPPPSFQRDPVTGIPSTSAPTHDLSPAAYGAAARNRHKLALKPLLSGPLAILSFPSSEISTAHLKTALSVLAPEKPHFPPPTRRLAPGYHDPVTQSGIQKLLMLGARIEGGVYGVDEPKKVGAMEGGIGGLRAQVVGLLQGAGGGLVQTLESAARGLWVTMEGRRAMIEVEGKPKEEQAAGVGDAAGAEAKNE